MKNFAKLFLMFVLFTSTALADGHTGHGGRADCTPDCPPPCTENCGGFYESEETKAAEYSDVDEQENEDSMIEYLSGIFWDMVL